MGETAPVGLCVSELSRGPFIRSDQHPKRYLFVVVALKSVLTNQQMSYGTVCVVSDCGGAYLGPTRQKVPFPVLDSERGARQNIFGDFGLRQNIFGDFALWGKYTRDKWICLRRQITYGRQMETNGDK